MLSFTNEDDDANDDDLPFFSDPYPPPGTM